MVVKLNICYRVCKFKSGNGHVRSPVQSLKFCLTLFVLDLGLDLELCGLGLGGQVLVIITACTRASMILCVELLG